MESIFVRHRVSIKAEKNGGILKKDIPIWVSKDLSEKLEQEGWALNFDHVFGPSESTLGPAEEVKELPMRNVDGPIEYEIWSHFHTWTRYQHPEMVDDFLIRVKKPVSQ